MRAREVQDTTSPRDRLPSRHQPVVSGPSGPFPVRPARRPLSQDALIQLQHTVGNRRTVKVLARRSAPDDQSTSEVIQRDWVDTNNSNLGRASGSQKQALKDLVPGISRVPTQIKTIVPKSGSTNYRIDMQGSVRRSGTVYANVQCQIGDDSIAGVICPFDLALETIKSGLEDALDREAVLEWEPEEGEFVTSDHLDDLLSTAEQADFDLSGFQDIFDAQIEALAPELKGLYTQGGVYSVKDVEEKLDEVSLQGCLSQYSPGLQPADVFNRSLWAQDFERFARSFIKENVDEALPHWRSGQPKPSTVTL